MKFNLRVALVFLAVLFLYYGCENQTVLRSARTLRKQIQGTWTMVPLGDNQLEEQWRFIDGAVYRYERPANSNAFYTKADSGLYALNATLTEPFLLISDMASGNNCYNAKWQIIRLDDDVLVIIHDQDCKGLGKGLLTREFYKDK